MANEVGPIRYTSGASLTYTLTNDAGDVWDNVAGDFVTAATATYANCAMAMTEQGATGRFYASLPVSANLDVTKRYNVLVKLAASTTWADTANMIAEGIVEPQKSPATLAAADVTGNVPVDVQTIKGQAVTCAAPVTVPATIGTSTLTQEQAQAGLATSDKQDAAKTILDGLNSVKPDNKPTVGSDGKASIDITGLAAAVADLPMGA